MKKLIAACVCAGLSLSMSGCSLGTVLEQFTSTGDSSGRNFISSSEDNTTTGETKNRVYMDEISGTLQDFSGNQLILNTEDASYVFNISNATLECEGGMITGDEISIIYEGQLSGTDTSTVRILKVVDEFHKKHQLEERTTRGQVLSLTSNTITIRSKKKKATTYPITGSTQYYQNGIKSGDWVYVTFKGTLPDTSEDPSASLNASHLKVLSISDQKTLLIPDPTPTPGPNTILTPEEIANKEKQFLATIQGVDLNVLHILPAGSSTVLNLDMSAIPVYFKGGIAKGSHVNVTYIGERQEDTLEGIRIIAVTGEDPDTIDYKHISFTATGTIIGSTANTITIRTDDGAVDTFRTEGAKDLTEGGAEYGDYVCITFHPSESKSSNIYTSVKIQNA